MESKINVDVSKLSETERQLIFNVLKRDEDLRKRDEQRINRLKAELNWLRRRGAIKGGLNPLTSCDRCRCELGRIINRGAPCAICLAKTCKSCRIYPHEGTQWICVVCHKQLELEVATGEWMNEFVRRASRKRDRKGFVPSSSDIVKELILRSQLESDHDRQTKEGPKRGPPFHSVSTQARTVSSMESSSPRPRRNTIDAGQQSLDFQHYPVCPRGEVYDSVGVDSDGTEAGQGVRSSDAPVPFPRHRSPLTKQRTIQADVESPVTVDRSSVQVRGSTATTRRQAPQPPPAVPATHQSDRSDSGISQGVQSSPKSSSHSDSIPSWRSNSNGSSSGRPDGKGTANVPSEQLADTTTSVLVDNGSDISDCEVEPSTGVVFRKVTLRRKKRKDVEGVKRDEAEDEEDEAEEEEEDDNEEDVDPPIVLSEDDGRRRPDGGEEESIWKTVHVRPWWGVAGSSFSLPRFSHSRSQAAVASSHTPWEPFFETPPGGGGPLTRTNSCDSLWWDATASKTTLVLDGLTDVGGGSSSVTGVACGRGAKRVCREYRPPLNGWLLPFADSGQASIAPPSNRSFTDERRWRRRSVGDEGSSGSWDDLRVSSPEFEDDDALDANFSSVSTIALPPSVGANNHQIVVPGLKHADSFSDLLSHVTDKIVPEGDEYRIVFISSSSSKSSGLNSLDGSSSGNSSRRVSMLMEDDGEWDGAGSVVVVVGNDTTSPLPPPLPLAPPPLALQDAVTVFESEDLYDYFRDFANAEWKEKSVAVLDDSEHEDEDGQQDIEQMESSGDVRCLTLRRVDSFTFSSGERSVGEQTFYNSVVPVSSHPDVDFNDPVGEDSAPHRIDECQNHEGEVTLIGTITMMRDCEPGMNEMEVVATDDEQQVHSDTSDEEDTNDEFYSLAYVDEGIDSSDDECVFGVYEVNRLVDDQIDADEEGLDDRDLVIDFSEPEGGSFAHENPDGGDGDDGDAKHFQGESQVVVVSESSTPVIMVHVAGPETVPSTEEVVIVDVNVGVGGPLLDNGGENIDLGSTVISQKIDAFAEQKNNGTDSGSNDVVDNVDVRPRQEEVAINPDSLCHPEEKSEAMVLANNEHPLLLLDEGVVVDEPCFPLSSSPQPSDKETNNFKETEVLPGEQFDDMSSIVPEEGDEDTQGETSSDGEKLGSDTDSLDTVIEGESFRRMRQLAIRQKLLQANKDWDAGSLDETSGFNSVDVEHLPPHSMLDDGVVSDEPSPVVTELSLHLSNVEVSNENKESNEYLIGEDMAYQDSQSSPFLTIPKAPADLHQLVAQSRALTASLKTPTNRSSIIGESQSDESPSESSVLEKYFMTSLEHMAPPGFLRGHVHRRPPWLEDALNRSNSSEESKPSIDDVQIEVYSTSSLSDDGDLADSWSETQSDTYCELDRPIVSADEGDSETTFDEDECSSTSSASSSSSDEGSACLRAVPSTRPCVAAVDDAWYRLDMSLHTIIEESCEESESERERHQEDKKKRTKVGQVAGASELERYFHFGFAGGPSEAAPSSSVSSPSTPPEVGPVSVESHVKPPVQAQTNPTIGAKSPKILPSTVDDGDFSDDTYSETESSVFSECSNRDDVLDDEELAQLAASRLEKYFLTGFLGLEMGQTDFDNEEDVTTPTSEQPPLSFPPNPQDTPLKAKGYEEETPPVSSKEDTEDEETIAFNKNDGCNTIKRKKKSEDEAVVDGELDDDVESLEELKLCEKGTEGGDSIVNENSNSKEPLMVNPQVDIITENIGTTKEKEFSDESLATEIRLSPPSELDNKDGQPSTEEDHCLVPLKPPKVDGNEEIVTVTDSVIENLETLRSGLAKSKLLDDQQYALLDKNSRSLAESIVDVEHDNSKILSWDASCCYSETTNPCLVTGVGGMTWGLSMDWKQQSRDSGFIGSSDDLLQEEGTGDQESGDIADSKQVVEDSKLCSLEVDAGQTEEINNRDTSERVNREIAPSSASSVAVAAPTPTPFGLFRSSSTRSNFGAASTTSDDEAQYIVNQLVTQIAKSMSKSPQLARAKPPEIEVFESELTKLMQTIPGIDATVKEIVEELSSTDYCSDSYESSDYGSSDHEGSLLPPRDGSFRVALSNLRLHRADSGRSVASSTASRCSSVTDENQRLPEETMYIYQRFMDSLTKMTEHVSEEAKAMEQIGNGGSVGQAGVGTKGSPPTAVKMLHHIRSKLTSLMREVQADRSPRLGVDSSDGGTNRRVIVWNKPGSGAGSAAGDELSLSSTSSTAFDSEDSPTDTEPSVDSDEVVPGGPCGESATAARDNAAALSEARALVRALATGSGDIPGDEEEDNGSGADGLERWSSDMTIVDDDVRFISIHRSEPVLSMPESPGIQKRNSADLSSTKILATSPTHSASTSRPHSVQGGHPRGGAGSASSLYHRTFKSEWEVWTAPSSGGSASSLVSSSVGSGGVGSGHRPYKHKSCDPLPSESGRKETKSVTAPSTRDKKKHGGLAFMLRQKSGSVASLRDNQGNGSSSVTDVRPIKLQVHSRSSLHLQSGKTKEETLSPVPTQQQGASQQRASSLHRLFGVGHRHREASSHASHFKKGLGGGFLTSTSSPSSSSPLVKSCRSNPEGLSQVGVDVTTATGVDLSDDESGEGRKAQRPSSAHYPLYSGTDSDLSCRDDTDVGNQVTTIYVPSGAYSRASPRDVSAAADPNAKAKAFTLPRAGIGGASVPLHENVSFLHKSSRGGDSLSSYSLSPMSTNTLPHSYTLVVPQSDRTPNVQRDKLPHHNPPPRLAAGVAKTVVVQASNSSPGFQREAKSWPETDSSVHGKGNSTTDSPSSADWHGRRGKSQSPQPTASKYGLQSPSVTVSECPERSAVRGSSASSHTGSSDPEEDIDRLVALHRDRSLSQLGVFSESMSSVYSAAGGGHYGNVTVRGEVQFSLSYNYVSGALEVHVKQCRDLAPVDTKRNRSDPYVKVYLLPDKSKSGKRKTRVKKHTLNPLFNEVLKFHVTISELETRTLWLTVWHSDMFGRNEFLGEVTLPMGYEAWDDTSSKWYMLQERLGPPEEVYSYKGDLVLSLKFVSPDVTTQKKGRRSKGSLHVLVKEARNLMATSANGTSDPFCKCYLLPEKGKGNKQKTHVAKRTCNPKWNHTFLYEDVSLDELKERCLELTLWDYDRLTSNDFLGGVRLSLGTGKHQGKKVDWIDSRGEEVTIWQNMLEKPNMWVDGTILLRPTMDPRQTTSW